MIKKVVFWLLLSVPLMAAEGKTLKGFQQSLSSIASSLSNWNLSIKESFSPPRGFSLRSWDQSFRFVIQPFHREIASEIRLELKKRRGGFFGINFQTENEEVSRYDQLIKSYEFLSDKMGFELKPFIILNKTNQILCGVSNLFLPYPQSNSSLLIEVHSFGKKTKHFEMDAQKLLRSIDFRKIDSLLGEDKP